MKGRSKNVWIFGGAPENDERNMARLETKNWDNNGMGYFASVLWWFQNNGIFYYSSLNIGRVCYKEKSPFPRFKWIEDPYNLFGWVLKIKWHDGMMTWCNAKIKEQAQKKHTAKLGIAGSLLEHRSRGVTTLHHYKRISSRDLAWHRRENGRGREEVKLSCFFDKRVKPKNVERLKSW